MTIRHVTKLLAALALCLGTTSTISTAHADWIILDCHGTNGVPTWGGTTSTILVAATRTDGTSDVRWVAAPTGKCGADDAFPIFVNLNAQTVLPMRSIDVYISGPDEFFIDRIRVMNNLMTVEYTHFGANNTSGWCLSTQAEGNNASCGPAELFHSFVLDPPISGG
jgi:hypothetical protein